MSNIITFVFAGTCSRASGLPRAGGRRVVVVRSHSRRRRLAANRREFRCSGVYSMRFRHVVAVIR